MNFFTFLPRFIYCVLTAPLVAALERLVVYLENQSKWLTIIDTYRQREAMFYRCLDRLDQTHIGEKNHAQALDLFKMAEEQAALRARAAAARELNHSADEWRKARGDHA